MTHTAIPISFWIAFGNKFIPTRLLIIGILFSILPDVDVIAFQFGIPYESDWGHRGFSHSILFSFSLSVLACVLVRWLRARIEAVFSFVSFDSFSRSSGRDDRRRTRSGISHPLFIRKIFLYVETNRRFTHRNQKFFDIERPGSSEIGTFHGMDSVVIDRSFDFFNTNSEDRCAYQGLKNRNPLCRHSEKLTDSEQTIL